MSGFESNKALVRRYYEEVLNQRKLKVIDELFGEDFVSHGPSGTEGNLAKYKLAVAATHAAFPDLFVTIEDQIAEDDKVLTRWSAQATHKGPYFGLAPTQRRVRVTAMHIHRIAQSKLVEHWEEIDLLGMMAQVGLKPKL